GGQDGRAGRLGYLLADDEHGRRGGDAPLGGQVVALGHPAGVLARPYAAGERRVDDADRTGDVDELVVAEPGAALGRLGGEQRLPVRLELAQVGGAGTRRGGAGGVAGWRTARVEEAERMPDQRDLVGRDELVEDGRRLGFELPAERA